MSNVKFNALASLALLAGAPVVAQAEMVEMAETELSDVSGQAAISALRWAPFVPTDALPTFVDGDGINLTPVFNPLNIFNSSFTAASTAVGTAGTRVINAALLPLTAPSDALSSFNSRVGSNAASVGTSIADLAFAPILKPIDLAKQGVGTALNYAFFPISAPLKVAENVFTNLNNGVVGTSTRILTAPINAVINPVNRVLDTAANIGKKPVNAVLNPINNAVADVAFLASGVAKGVEFSFVGALGGATTKVLAAGATATNSRLLYNMTIATNQARLLRQQSIGKPLNVNVSVPTVDFN